MNCQNDRLSSSVEVTAETDSVSRERFVASQRTVAALLRERELIMDALIGLVNAAHPFRHQGVCLAHEQHMGRAWKAAFALVEAWTKAAVDKGGYAGMSTERTESPT